MNKRKVHAFNKIKELPSTSWSAVLKLVDVSGAALVQEEKQYSDWLRILCNRVGFEPPYDQVAELHESHTLSLILRNVTPCVNEFFGPPNDMQKAAGFAMVLAALKTTPGRVMFQLPVASGKTRMQVSAIALLSTAFHRHKIVNAVGEGCVTREKADYGKWLKARNWPCSDSVYVATADRSSRNEGDSQVQKFLILDEGDTLLDDPEKAKRTLDQY